MLKSFLCLLFFISVPGLAAESDDDPVVVSNAGVDIGKREMEAILATASESLRAMVADNEDDRLEYLNSLMTSRAIAAQADSFTKDDPEYWELYFALINAKRIFMTSRMIDEMAPSAAEILVLAQERYDTQRDKYALIPEKRGSSHILFAAEMGENRRELRELAESVLIRLQAGEVSWEDMVAEYSEDPGSAAREGKLTTLVEFGDNRITPTYVAALFNIEDIGGFADITDSPFGVHIIRLDEIVSASYKPIEEVLGDIIGDLEGDFRASAVKEIRSRYFLKPGESYINGPLLEQLLAPYKTSD